MPLPIGITAESQFGLDYGPAPGNIDEAEQNFLNRQAKHPEKVALTKPEIARILGWQGREPSMLDSVSGAAYADEPPVQADRQVGGDNPSVPPPAGKSSGLSINYAPPYKNVNEYVKSIMSEGDLELGDALGVFQQLYDSGDELTRQVPGAEELRRGFPGMGESFMSGFGASVGEGAGFIGKTLGIPGGKETYETSKQLEEFTPPSWSKTFGGLAGDVLKAEAIVPLAEPLAGAALSKVPYFADALKAGARAEEKLFTDTKMVEESSAAIGRYMGAKSTLTQATAFSASQLLSGEGLGSAAIGFGAGVLGDYAVRGLVKLPGLRKIFGRNGFQRATEFLAEKSGQPLEVFKANLTSADQVVQMLDEHGASAEYIGQLFSKDLRGADKHLGEYMGNYAANLSKNSDWLDKALGDSPTALGHAKEAYTKAMDYYYTATVVDQPLLRVGLDKYAPPMSKWHETLSDGGKKQVKITGHRFVRPYVVQYGPGEHPAETAIYNLINEVTDPAAQRPFNAAQSDASRIASYMLNRASGMKGKVAYDDLAEGIAASLANKQGYQSIIYKGPSADQDFYLDLTRMVKGKLPDQGIAAAVKKFEDILVGGVNDIHWNGTLADPIIGPVGKGMKGEWIKLGLIGLLGGAGLTAASPGQSDAAMDFGVLRKMAAEIGDDSFTKLLMRTHTEMKHAWLALNHLASNESVFTASEAIQKLEGYNDIIKASPEKLGFSIKTIPSVWSSKTKDIIAEVTHPDIPFPIAKVEAASFATKPQELHIMSVDGIAPGNVPPGFVKGVFKTIKSGVEADTGIKVKLVLGTPRLAGMGRGHDPTIRMRNLILPIGLGAAAVFTAGQANAGTLDKIAREVGTPEAFTELIGDFRMKNIAKQIIAFLKPKTALDLVGHIDRINNDLKSGKNLVTEIAEPAVQDVYQGMRNMTAGTSEEQSYINRINHLQDRVTNAADPDQATALKGELVNMTRAWRRDFPSSLGDKLNVNIGHKDLGPFPVASISGWVNPHDGLWYPEISGAKLGKKGLKAVFAEVAEKTKIKGIGGSLAKLGIMAALLYAGTEALSDNTAEASVLGDMFGNVGTKIADDVVADAAGSRTAAEILGKMRKTVLDVGSRAASGTYNSAGDEAFAKFGSSNMQEFGEDVWRAMGMADAGKGLKAGYVVRTPLDVTNNPIHQVNLAQFMTKKERLITGKDSLEAQLIRQASGILKKFNVKEENGAEFRRAYDGLQRIGGKIVQSDAKADVNHSAAAKELFEQVMDPLWHLNTGIDPAARDIIQANGLENNKTTFQVLKALQDNTDDVLPREILGVKILGRHITAAEQTKGMLRFDITNDLDLPYHQGNFVLRPIANEKQELVDEIKRLSSMYPNGLPADKQDTLKRLTERYRQVEAEEATARMQERNLRGQLSTKRGTFGKEQDKDKFPLLNNRLTDDPVNGEQGMISWHITGMVNKRFWDEQSYFGAKINQVYRGLGLEELADYNTEMLNTFKGMRGFREDRIITGIWNSIRGKFGIKPKDIQRTRGFAKQVMGFQYLTKLGLSPRWPIVNASQSLMAYVVTGGRPFFEAVGKTAGNWEQAVKEASEAGILKAGSGWREEVQSAQNWGIMNKLDKIPSMSENFNRVLTFQAGKAHALQDIAKGTFKPAKFLRGFNRSVLERGTPEQIATEYAKSLVRTTQFMFGPEGRPLGMSGGVLRKTLFQFKSFPVNFALLAYDITKHIGEDPKPAMRLAATMYALGGGAAIFQNYGWDAIRHSMLKHAGINLPSGSGLWYHLGMDSPNTSEEMKGAMEWLRAPQISGSLSPLNLPNALGDPASAMNFALGPTLGGAYSAGQALYKWGVTGENTPVQAAAGVVRQILPGAVPALEAAQEANMPVIADMLNKVGYRGSIYSPSGKRISYQRSLPQIIARGLNLQPSVRSQRYEYLGDIQAAMEGGRMALAKTILMDARAKGLIITKQDVAQIKARITRDENLRSETNPYQNVGGGL